MKEEGRSSPTRHSKSPARRQSFSTPCSPASQPARVCVGMRVVCVRVHACACGEMRKNSIGAVMQLACNAARQAALLFTLSQSPSANAVYFLACAHPHSPPHVCTHLPSPPTHPYQMGTNHARPLLPEPRARTALTPRLTLRPPSSTPDYFIEEMKSINIVRNQTIIITMSLSCKVHSERSPYR